MKLVCRKAKWHKSSIGLFGVNLLLGLFLNLGLKKKMFSRTLTNSPFFSSFFFYFSQILTIVLFSPVKMEQLVSMP